MKMKNFVWILYLPLILLPLMLPVASAEYHYHSSDSGETAVAENWDKLLEALPDDVKNELNDITMEDISGTAEAISEKADIRYWIQKVWECLTGSLNRMLPKIAPLFAMMIFMAAVQLLLPSSASPNLQKAFLTYTGLVTALTLYRQTYDVIAVTKTCLERLCSIMNLMTPVMEAVFLSTGAVTQMAVSAQAVMLFVTAAGNFAGYLLAPLTSLLFTLSAVAAVCDEVKMSHLIGSLRKWILRLIQLFTMYFSFMLGTQSILAKSADSLGMKTARFALSSFIPVAGGTIAEALSTLREGMSLLKNAAGIGGILMIVLLILPDLLTLAVYKFTLYLTGTAADCLRLGKFSALSNEIHGIVELLMAVVLFTSLMFVLVLILFTKSQVTI